MAEPRLRLPVYVAGSHVRLTDTHAKALFGEPLSALFSGTPNEVCLQMLRVRGADVTLDLRVLRGATVTEVRLSGDRFREFPEGEAVHLDGPRGAMVLATAPLVVGRYVALTEADALELDGPTSVTVHVQTDRARVFNDLPVEPARESALWVEAEDLGPLELTADAVAQIY